jgi:hypothetical protein
MPDIPGSMSASLDTRTPKIGYLFESVDGDEYSTDL